MPERAALITGGSSGIGFAIAKQVVGLHRDAYGRMDVLISNARLGIGGPIEGADTKKVDMQLDVNLRGVYLVLRESIPMLKEGFRSTARPSSLWWACPRPRTGSWPVMASR